MAKIWLINAKKKKSKNFKSQTFQEIIMNLQKYWGKYGCILLQPYDLEVGAGTFHPATTLRSLGPSPGKQLMFNLPEDLLMDVTEKIQIDYNIIINIK